MRGFFVRRRGLSRTSSRKSFAFNGSIALLGLTFVHSSAMLSFRAQRSGAKNLALDFSADKQQGEMLLPQGGIPLCGTVSGRYRERRSLGPSLSTGRG